MRRRSVTPGQQCRRRLCVLLGVSIFVFGFFPACIPESAQEKPNSAVRIPSGLRPWAHPDTFAPGDTAKALKEGIDYFNNEQYLSALKALPENDSLKSTAIGDYVLLYRAKSHLMMDHYEEALDQFRLLETEYPDSSLIREVVLGQCEAFLGLKDPKAASTTLKSHNLVENSEILYCQARASQQAGETDQAIALFLKVYSKYPASSSAPLAEHSLQVLSPGALKGSHNFSVRLLRAETLLKSGEFRSARLLLSALGRVAAPDTITAQKRRLLMAEVEYRMGKTFPVLSLVRKVTAEDASLHARALYLEGASYRRLDREQSFLSLRDKALKMYPSSPQTEELCYSVATYFDVSYEYAKSREAYRTLYRAFPNGQHAERALWKLCMFSYLAKQYVEAALGFWNYLLAYPKPSSAVSAMYWMGRCLEKLGKSGNAKYLYARTQALSHYSYYGQRAREAEASLPVSGNIEAIPIPGLDFKQLEAACEAIQLSPTAIHEPDTTALRLLERAQQLLSAGLQDLALSELRWSARRYPQNSRALFYVMSRIYANTGDFDDSISCLRTVFPDYSSQPLSSLPEEIWQLLYPVRHLDTITEQASKTATDPALILGIIRQESAFEESARSNANARGLMQILPSTGLKLARQARIRRYNSRKLFDAEINIMLGTLHLASLFQEYGKPEIVLASYNAGETRADRWLKEFGNEDMAEFVERIPFYETRNYVKQVLSNRAYYKLLTSSPSPASQ